MASEKAMYWLAVGVMALGLNSTYQQGEFCWAHRMADRAAGVAERTAQRGLSFLSLAEVMAGRNPSEIARLQAMLGRLQARESLRAAQVDELAQAQRELQEMNVQLEGLQGAVKVQCPRVRVTRHVRDAMVDVVSPQVQDGMIVVNGTQVDVRRLESLRSLEALKGLQSMEAFTAFESMNSPNFKFVVPPVPGNEMHFKFRVQKKDDDGGTI